MIPPSRMEQHADVGGGSLLLQGGDRGYPEVSKHRLLLRQQRGCPRQRPLTPPSVGGCRVTLGAGESGSSRFVQRPPVCASSCPVGSCSGPCGGEVVPV